MNPEVLQLHAPCLDRKERGLAALVWYTTEEKLDCLPQGGIWISLECLQPLQCKIALNRKELRGLPSLPCPAAAVCSRELLLSSLAPLPKPPACGGLSRTEQAPQALPPQLTALSISAPHNSEEWTAKGTYTLTCHNCFSQRTPASLLQRQYCHSSLQTQKKADTYFL